jgi:chorismate lyase / 3-hydroxybenzoate synthase
MPVTRIRSTQSHNVAFLPPPLIIEWTREHTRAKSIHDIAVTLRSGPRATLASVTVAAARSLEAGDFADRVTAAYQAIESTIAATEHAHVVRWWNGIPGIHDRVDNARDRYMAFNAGRFAAMRRRYGDASLAEEAPAASGVGIAGDALVIHALSAATPGRSLQNVRQRPAVRYSSRFGPLPPCFARATLSKDVADAPTLLISGTAAILGEDTVHPGDLDGQLAVTLDHLRKLIGGSGIATTGEEMKRVRSLRVYVPTEATVALLGKRLEAEFPAAVTEFVLAELCRRDLLVEIECIASGNANDHGA